MTEHEKKLQELANKASLIDSTVRAAAFRAMRARKSLQICKDTCRSANELMGVIGATNGRIKDE